MEEILANAEEFLASGEDNLKKERWNAAVSDYFKAIVTFADYLIYQKIKTLPKSHNERFQLLEKYFKNIYDNLLILFKKYRETYNIRLSQADAQALRIYAHEIKSSIPNK